VVNQMTCLLGALPKYEYSWYGRCSNSSFISFHFTSIHPQCQQSTPPTQSRSPPQNIFPPRGHVLHKPTLHSAGPTLKRKHTSLASPDFVSGPKSLPARHSHIGTMKSHLTSCGNLKGPRRLNLRLNRIRESQAPMSHSPPPFF
jgi:hypothetical protein